MSHWTAVKTQVKDLQAVMLAASSLGLVTEMNANCRGYFTHVTNVCDLVVKLKGPYDVGLKKNAEGTYDLVMDEWRGHVEAEVGKGASRLMQEYSYQVVAKQARAKGLMLNRVNREDGTIKLTLRGM